MTFKYQQEEVNDNDSKGTLFISMLPLCSLLELAKKIYEKLDEMAVEKK